MKINERGCWQGVGGHKFDPSLSAALVDMLKLHGVEKVIDIGCGDGSYVKALIEQGIDCVGYDGNPMTPEITGELCGVADFSEPQDLGLFDCVLSLEVGEHIPLEFMPIYLDNLASHARDAIILSWAVPGQTGHGHVNEQSNAEIIQELSNREYWYDYQPSEILRKATSNCYWFKDTIMVFRNGR